MVGDAVIAAVVVFVLSFAILSGAGPNFLGQLSHASLVRARALRVAASLVIAAFVAVVLMHRG